MEGYLHKRIKGSTNIDIDDYFFYYSNFGGLNKFLEINTIVDKVSDDVRKIDIILSLENKYIFLDPTSNYFIHLENINLPIDWNRGNIKVENVINNNNPISWNNHTIKEFMKLIEHENFMFFNVTKCYRFNLNSVDAIFREIVLLDEFFTLPETTRIYKINNFFYFLNHYEKS